MTTETFIEIGALAEIIEDTRSLYGERQHRKGERFEVADYVTAEQAEDGEPFYYGNNEGGMNNVCVLADKVQQVMSKEQMHARALPSLKDVRHAIGSAMCGLYEDGFSTNETDYSDDDGNEVMVYGSTTEGLGFGIQVTVEAIYYTEDLIS